MKNLILGGSAAALGGAADYAAGRNRKKNRDKQSADSFGMAVMGRAVIKKACDLMRKEAAHVLCRLLDVVAGSMSLEKSAAVRSLERDIASGKPLAAAIKTAYPRLSGEQRGILASQMVRSALAHQHKKADALSSPEIVMQSANATITPPPGVMQTQRSTFQGTPQDGMSFMKAAGNKTAVVSPSLLMQQPPVGSGPASTMTASNCFLFQLPSLYSGQTISFDGAELIEV